jgi:6-pyruvoyltetrahydropterin/6-carboxytetrahydropterin synthase
LNASHYIYIQGKTGVKHPHTWEITLDMLKVKEGFVQFKELESQIDQFMMQFQDAILNEVSPFDVINPTLENTCEYFKEKFQEILSKNGWVLLIISMSETPTRAYVISLMNDQENMISSATDAIIDNVLERVKKMEI